MESFEALYRQFAPAVYRYAIRRCDREVDADDVVAETFAVCWRRLADVPVDHELPWLYGVARRVLANQRRSSGRLDRLRSRLRSEQLVSLGAGGAEEGVARSVLDRMSAGDQELLRLALWEGLTPSEMAVVLGITDNALYIRLHRARQRFAALYERVLGGQS